MALFSIFITLLFILWGLIKKRSLFATAGLLFLIFILFAFEKSEGDYLGYLNMYSQIGYGFGRALTYEPLYVLLCEIGNHFHLTFDTFRGIICVIEIALLYSTIRRYTNNTAMVLALFLIFPASLDAELFRWLMGMCIIIFFIRFLLEARGLRDYLIYTVGVAIAGLCHTSCFIFIIYLLMAIKDRQMLRRIVRIALLVGVAVIGTGIFFKLLSYLPIRIYVIEKYQTGNYSNWRGVFFSLVKQILIYSMIVIANERISINKQGKLSIFHGGEISQNSNPTALFQERIQDLNIISFLLLIPLYYSSSVQRLTHVVAFLNYIALANYGNRSGKVHVLYGALVAILLLLSLLFLEGTGTMAEFQTHFTEGYFINFFQTIFG